MTPAVLAVKGKSSRCNVFEKSGSFLTGMGPVPIVDSMNTNNTGPDSSNDPSTQTPQDSQDNEEPHSQDAEDAPGGVDDNFEPVVDLPNQEQTEVQDAMGKLVEAATVLLKHFLPKTSPHSCGDCADEEPVNIAYGASFDDADAAVDRSMGDYFSVGPSPSYIPLGSVSDTLFGDRSRAKQNKAQRHSFSIGLGLGSAVATMGVNALIRDLIWSVSEVSTDLGSVVRGAFGKSSLPRNVMRMARPPWSIPRPPTTGDSDVTRMPIQESWGSFCRGSVPETPGPSAATPDPASDTDEFIKKVMDLKEQVAAGTEKHDDIVDIFKHFEDLFGEFFPFKKP